MVKCSSSLVKINKREVFCPSQVCSARGGANATTLCCKGSSVGTSHRGQSLFLNVTHLNEAENQEFHECGQTSLNANPCSLGSPAIPGKAGGKSPNYGTGKELLKPTQLHFAIFFPLLKPVLNSSQSPNATILCLLTLNLELRISLHSAAAANI